MPSLIKFATLVFASIGNEPALRKLYGMFRRKILYHLRGTECFRKIHIVS